MTVVLSLRNACAPASLRKELAKRALLLGVCGLIGMSIGSTGCGGCSRKVEHNLLLITIDTLRADSLGAYGYEESVSPSIDRLAERSMVFERAYSTAPFTAPSHASILTSQHPSTTGVIYNGHRVRGSIANESVTLAEHLSRAGFATAAVVSGGPLGEKYGFARGFQEYTRIRKMKHGDIGGAGSLVDSAAEEWLLRRSEEGRNRRFFLWLHYFDPHLPYTIPKALREEVAFAPDFSIRRKRAAELPNDVVRRGYRAEVLEVDRHIGAILGLLDEHGLSENTLVALTADHGEYLQEHGLIDHSQLYDEVLHVPMIIHWPGRRAAERHPRPVSTIDLVPALLAILGVDPLPGAQGRNLLASSDPDRDHPVFAEWRDFRMLRKSEEVRPGDFLVSVQLGDTKYVQDVLFPESSALYDLEKDPDELVDRSSEDPETASRMKEMLSRHLAEDLPDGLRGVEKIQIDEESKKMLRELGYIR